MATPESKRKKELKENLAKGLSTVFPGIMWYCSPIGSKFGRNGAPDMLFCIGGLFVGIEVKASPRDKATQLQLKRLNEIRAAGGIGGVVCDNESFGELVATIATCLNLRRPRDLDQDQKDTQDEGTSVQPSQS